MGRPNCRNSSRLFLFFPRQSLSLPLACGWSRQRRASQSRDMQRGKAAEAAHTGVQRRAEQRAKHLTIRPTLQGSLFALETGANEREQGAEEEREREREREEGGALWEWRKKNDTEIHSSSFAQTHCTLSPYWDRLYAGSALVSTSEKSSRGNKTQRSECTVPLKEL